MQLEQSLQAETPNSCGAGVDMEDGLPDNEYREYFAPSYKLHLCLQPHVSHPHTTLLAPLLPSHSAAASGAAHHTPECLPC